MVLKDFGAFCVKDKAVDITIRDISLQRLYGILFVFFELYSDYSFNIIRKSKFYELNFQGWGAPKRGRDALGSIKPSS